MKTLSYRISPQYGFLKALLIVMFLTAIKPVYAQVSNPLQIGHYFPGVINTRDMANPPSGLFVLMYNFYTSSDTYVDRNGNKFDKIPLSEIHPILPDIEVDVKLNGFGTVPLVAWASKKIPFLGNARYVTGIAPNYVVANSSLTTKRQGNIIDTTIVRGFTADVSDLMFIPLGLSWGWEHFDLSAYYTVYAPTGRFDPTGVDNIGLGFWTHQFQGFTYYYPKVDKSTGIFMGLTYEINSNIKDANLKPGSRFSLEWGFSQFLSNRLEVGLQGGHNWQVSDDTGSDIKWDSEIYDKKSSQFFNISYWPVEQRLMLNLYDYLILCTGDKYFVSY